MSLRGLDNWITREPDDDGPCCEPCRRAGHGAPGRWFDATNDIWLCDDCLDEKAFEAREPITEYDIDQIDDEIFEYEAQT